MQQPPLIPRRLLFGNPDRSDVKISPDGSRIAYQAPVDGILNVWVGLRDELGDAKPVTADKGRGIRIYFWAYTSRHILYLQDIGGDEKWRLYCVDIDTGDTRDLTPIDGARATIAAVSHKSPTEILVSLNQRDPAWADLYRINVLTGERSMVLQNHRFAGFIIDDDYKVVLGLVSTDDGGTDIFRHRDDGEWELWDRIAGLDSMTTSPISLDSTGHGIYMADSRGRETSALIYRNLDGGSPKVLAADPACDLSRTVIHPTDKHAQAVAFTYLRQRWQVLDPTIEGDLSYLADIAHGELEIGSRSLDDRYWIVSYGVDNGPTRYYLYDRHHRSVGKPARSDPQPARFLFTNRTALEGLPLAPMHSRVISSRDRLDLVAYFTVPLDSDVDENGLPTKPLPMVFIPHGGPWGRDGWGYNPYHQWLANRGYAVLCVNFRSSTGFGKSFVNAGDREWGGKIIDDQVDAVKWAIDAGLADSDRIAIFGASFGGFSVLCGLTMTPDLYACGIDIVGPSSLITLLESMPPHWKPMLEMLTTRVGDHRTKDGRTLLDSQSPLNFVERIKRPLLIGHGANDPRVKRAESDQIANAMKAKSIPVTYVLYPDEGHGFARPENVLSFNAIAEAFLAEHLGGRCEPFGSDFSGSSLEIVADSIGGLSEAINSKADTAI